MSPTILSKPLRKRNADKKTARTKNQSREKSGANQSGDASICACISDAWQTHESELFLFLLNQLDTREEAEDLHQEIFLRLLQQGTAFCQVKQPRSWLFRVARNALTDRRRRQKTLVELPATLAEDEVQRDAITELENCLLRNLEALSPAEREIIERCDLGGERQRAFAARHGISLPAAKARLQRARRKLRTAIVRNCRVRFDETGRVCCHRPPSSER